MEQKTKKIEMGYPKEFKELILFNDDIEIEQIEKDKIWGAKEDELLEVTKTIGSTPVKIESVKLLNEDSFLEEF